MKITVQGAKGNTKVYVGRDIDLTTGYTKLGFKIKEKTTVMSLKARPRRKR